MSAFRVSRRLLVVLLCLMLVAAVGFSAVAAQPVVKNPDTFIHLTISDPATLDWAWAFDTASFAVIFNIYETLIAFDGVRMDRFVPRLATQVPSLANGLISPDGRTYTFPIRRGVRFHDGTPMTPADVAWSLQRFLLTDRAGGPSKLLLEWILGRTSTRDADGRLNITFAELQRAIRVRGDNVVVTLARPFGGFLSIIAGWSYVQPKRWGIAHGDWDGTAATMARHNNPRMEATAFFERANGTGPFRLETWDRAGRQVILARNDNYWQAPAQLRRVVIRTVPEVATRALMLRAGDADSIALARVNLPMVAGDPNIRVVDNLPRGTVTSPALFFTFAIDCAGNPDCGSGRLDGAGIPPDFFSDINVRRGFAWSFDSAGFLRDAFHNRGSVARGMIPVGMFGHNPRQEYFSLSRERAIAAFREAWGGQVWERGFRMTLLFITGSVTAEMASRMVKDVIEGLNPRFRIDIRSMPFPAFLAAMDARRLPVYWVGWLADYPDPHNFAFHFLHTDGTFPRAQRFSNPEVDRLVMAAAVERDRARREQMYFQINQRYFELAPSVATVNAVAFHVQRTWVRGWYFNPLHPGTYYYTIFKR
jgi:peptide/nickel transport system substrate-binding protein